MQILVKLTLASNILATPARGGVYYDLQDGVNKIPAAYGHQKFVTCPAGSILIVVSQADRRSVTFPVSYLSCCQRDDEHSIYRPAIRTGLACPYLVTKDVLNRLKRC